MIHVSDYWFGTPRSLLQVLDAQVTYRENPLEFGKLLSGGQDPSEGEGSPLVQVHEGVAIVQINGPLTAQESWMDEYFGLTSYPALGRAVMEAVERHQAGEVHAIIHAFSTPGGDASGLNGVTEVMQAAKEAVPETVSYTGSHALSAGYWLASINDSLRVDRMGEVGSIGVVSTVRTIHRMLQEDGIDVKVIRSGRYKALLSPYEPFSEDGLKMVEEKGHELHQFFIEHILSSRPGLASLRQTDWAEGQTFFAEKAISLGLADGPSISLNALIASLVEKHEAARPAYSTSRGHSTMSKIVVSSPEEQAKLAAGVDLAHVDHEVVEEPETELAAPPPPTELVSYLKEEVAGLKARNAELEQRLSELSSQANAVALLGPPVIEAIHRLQVPLRQAPLQLEGLPPEVLARQYEQVRDQFMAQFPVGRHAKVEEDQTRAPTDLAEQRLLLVK